MTRWLFLLFGAAAVVLAVYVAVNSSGTGHAARRAPTIVADAGATSDGGAASAGDAGAADAGEAADAEPVMQPLLPIPPTVIIESRDGGPGYEMPTGGPAPPLAADAPRRVRFSVILVWHEGAERAPARARSKAAAKELAQKIAEEAKTDFRAAMLKGDLGIEDLHEERNMLEPATEYALFSLHVGEVTGPLETPLGYWIAKRLEW